MKDVQQINLEELVCDQYEDYLLLMDEEQMRQNRMYISATFGTLRQSQWSILLMPTRGSIVCTIGSKNYRCAQGQIMVTLLSEGFVMKSMSDDFQGMMIGMGYSFINQLNISGTLQRSLAIRRHPVSDINDQMAKAVSLVFAQLRNTIHQERNPHRHIILQLLVETYYYGVGFYLHNKADGVMSTSSEYISGQFLHMVERDFITHRDLNHYADALCISKNYLCSAVRRATGSTPSDWIERNVILYAGHKLIHSDLTVGQIAAELNFSTQSFFGQYFKRATGISPEAYRKEKRRSSSATYS